MKTFLINDYHYSLFANFPCSVAIGFFDGVHRGHQMVIQKAVDEGRKRGLKSAVMTFSPHPKEVIKNGTKVDKISTFAQKEKQIKMLGVDYIYVIHFDKKFASLTPREFVNNYLLRLNVKHVAVGFDFHYGHFGKGNVFSLAADGDYAFDVSVVDKISFKQKKISSTFIRQLIRDGNIDLLEDYLGYCYETVGFVKKVNDSILDIEEHLNLLPKSGVYEVGLSIHGHCYRTIAYCDQKSGRVRFYHFQSYPDVVENDQIKIYWLSSKQSMIFEREQIAHTR